jgi:hypothetical protein
MEIKFNVIHQMLKSADSNENKYLVADSKQYLIATFVYKTNEWNDIPVTALFTYNNKTYAKILGSDDGLALNQCYIPSEVIKSPGFSVSICCGDLITTDEVSVKIYKSGYKEEIVNSDITTNNISAQMTQLFQQYALICNQILQDCQAILDEVKEIRGEKK